MYNYKWLAIIIAVILVISMLPHINKVIDTRDVTVTITDKVVKNYDNDSKYLVFTEDAYGNVETYEITDSLLKFRFNSSDVYAALKVGSTYRLTIGGWRNNFFSWYPNIYEYKLINNGGN